MHNRLNLSEAYRTSDTYRISYDAMSTDIGKMILKDGLDGALITCHKLKKEWAKKKTDNMAALGRIASINDFLVRHLGKNKK